MPEHRRPHGTEAGYQGHRYRGEQACDRCKAGHRDYLRAQRKVLRRQRQVIRKIMGVSNPPKGETESPLLNWEVDAILRSIKEALDL